MNLTPPFGPLHWRVMRWSAGMTPLEGAKFLRRDEGGHQPLLAAMPLGLFAAGKLIGGYVRPVLYAVGIEGQDLRIELGTKLDMDIVEQDVVALKVNVEPARPRRRATAAHSSPRRRNLPGSRRRIRVDGRRQHVCRTEGGDDFCLPRCTSHLSLPRPDARPTHVYHYAGGLRRLLRGNRRSDPPAAGDPVGASDRQEV